MEARRMTPEVQTSLERMTYTGSPVTWGTFKAEVTQVQNMSPEGLKTGHYTLVLLIWAIITVKFSGPGSAFVVGHS